MGAQSSSSLQRFPFSRLHHRDWTDRTRRHLPRTRYTSPHKNGIVRRHGVVTSVPLRGSSPESSALCSPTRARRLVASRRPRGRTAPRELAGAGPVCSLPELTVRAMHECSRASGVVLGPSGRPCRSGWLFLLRPRGSARLLGDDRDFTRLIPGICLLCTRERLVT